MTPDTSFAAGRDVNADHLVVSNGDGRPGLRGSLCPECATRSFPPRPRCPRCWATTEETVLAGRGVVQERTPVFVDNEGVVGVLDVDGVLMRARLGARCEPDQEVVLETGHAGTIIFRSPADRSGEL